MKIVGTNLLIALCLLTGCAQENTEAMFQPHGEYRLLPLETTQRQVNAILQANQTTMTEVQLHPNNVTPPVLFALSYQLFVQDHFHDALFWFYTAQLRARSDANKSLDITTQQGVTKLSQQFGREITAYAKQHPDQLEQAMIDVLHWDKTAIRRYNPRWVALHGNEVLHQDTYAFMPMDRWPEIDRLTRDEFARGFARQMLQLRKGSGFPLTN